MQRSGCKIPATKKSFFMDFFVCSLCLKVFLLGYKIAAQKNVCFWTNFALPSMIFWVFLFLTPFNGLFAPTSQSPMTKLLRFSESLGKSNKRKWSQIWNLLLIKGVKLSPKKKCFWPILPCSIFFWYRCYYSHRSREALSPICWIFNEAHSFTKKIFETIIFF